MRADLHVHSKHSRRPAQWILQKLGCPESFTEPQQLYDIARRRGMTAVTITDHNTIGGALEIAHLDGTFLSEEVTAYFPEDRCKIHVLVYDISEAQHDEIQRLRSDVFDLVPYLRQEGIVHALAHPLFSVNHKLTAGHVEKCLLLFRNMELNGSREDDQDRLLVQILDHLTPRDIEELIDRHGINPLYPDPWLKNVLGGSDDHSSLEIACKYTEVADAETIKEMLDGIENHSADVGGRGTTPHAYARTIYSIAYQFYRTRFDMDRYARGSLLVGLIDRVLREQDAVDNGGLLSRLKQAWQHRRSVREDGPSSGAKLMLREAENLVYDDPALLSVARGEPQQDREWDEVWYDFVAKATNRVSSSFGDHLWDHIAGGNLFNLFETIGSAGSLYTLLAPYFVSYSLFSKDRQLGERISAQFLPEPIHKNGIKVAHFTDTFYEVNGVALTLHEHVRLARKSKKGLTVITCDHEQRAHQAGVKNFKPIGVYELPEYPEQKLFHPPLLDMLRYCYEKGFTHVHSATPGPLGLVALATARVLELPISGTYHTALPQYALKLTGDGDMEDLMWRFIIWYYEQLDFIYVPSKDTGEELIDRGLRPERVVVYPRGVDIDRFQPGNRQGYLDDQLGLAGRTKLLYVGRVSREKNLPLLVDSFRALCERRRDVSLVVIGDGPYHEEMQRDAAGLPIVFTGYLSGEPLLSAFADADLFVFPSTTDTFGNVILEAQASATPVIVTDRGGPHENVLPEETGVIVPGEDGEALLGAMDRLLQDPERLRSMGRRAREYCEDRSLARAFDEMWEMYGRLERPPTKPDGASLELWNLAG